MENPFGSNLFQVYPSHGVLEIALSKGSWMGKCKAFIFNVLDVPDLVFFVSFAMDVLH